MTVFRRVQGDIGDTIDPVIDGVQDLEDVTAVEAHVWRRGVEPVILDAAVFDPVARTILVQLGDAAGWLSDAAPGVWSVEYELAFGASPSLTWPAGIKDFIVVTAEGDPPAP